ncbi:TRAP transporter small permease [Neptunomonas japonica]|uniref:TRAP transporter small permease protein n=1 Tax=Neptunomonas japonica JAMM 1380 TaxID=1441457 RepID=A0A7R6PG75_9GAMM|nr:TRAP transporter small permease subunit [Neptunomonas japonica]BBB28596.1 TRAP dicarboxylate transporter DctQ subunit [Neptunomonas japonica JAMM 1380]
MTVQKHTAGDSSVYNFDPDLSDHPAPPHLSAIPEDEPQGIERLLVKFEQVLDGIFRVLMIMTGLGLSFLMFGQIIMRYVIESPFAGIEEAAVLLGVWIYFLGMGYATRVREHIHGGIVSLIITDPYKINMIRFAGSIISMTAACIFGYFAFKYALFVIDKGRMSINLQWPRGLWSSSMIVGFSMMAGYFLLEAINEFRALRKSRQARYHQE